MNIFRCAFRYVTRKKTRSIILTLILCILSALMLTVFSITGTAKAYLHHLETNFSREFIIDSRMSPGILTPDHIKKLVQRDDIAAYRYISNESPVCFRNETGTPLQVKTDGENCLVSPGFEHAGTLMSNLNSGSDEYFENGTFKLSSGRHLSEKDTQAILIHQDLASKNNLNIGDKIQLDFSDSIINDLKNQLYNTDGLTQQKRTFEITGIFETKEKNISSDDSSGLHLSHQLYANYCYIDFNTYASIFSKDTGYFNQTAFSISASADLETVVTEIKQLDWIDWSLCAIHSDLDNYKNILDALDALSNFLNGSLILTMPIAFFLLYLVLSNSVKQRNYEIGIFLVLGMSKSRILLQHIIEVFISAACAIILALVLSRGIARYTGNQMLANTLHSTEETADTGNMETNKSESVNIDLHPEALWNMIFIEALLIPLSVTAAGYKTIKKHPNEILKSLN